MQTIEEIKTCISATQNELNQKYKHISLRTYPFEDEVVDVLPCKGLYYSEDYWVENLFFITKKGYYFTNSDILKDSYWSFDDHQPYAEFLIGIAKIAKVVKFNADVVDVCHVAESVERLTHIVGGQLVLCLVVHVVDAEASALCHACRQFQQYAAILATAE